MPPVSTIPKSAGEAAKAATATTSWRLGMCLMLMLVAGTSSALAEDDLFELSLDELLEIEVTSVSGRAATLMDSAAAVFVITAEDIRRSGVTSIPEALRLAPGMEVAQVDGNKWAVSARGYNQRFTNKLLVLIDGRAVYNQIFSGVFWDVQETMLEDIERIEVIRGPGATLWGANAVNGVINIITRPASDTSGGLLNAIAGNQENATVAARWGGNLGDNGNYRVFAKYLERDANQLPGGTRSGDHWHQSRFGGRIDLAPSSRDKLVLTGEIYDGNSGETAWDLSVEEPYRILTERDQPVEGFNGLARWSRDLSPTEDFTAQASVDHGSRDWGLAYLNLETLDLYADLRTTRIARHDLLLGAGYRVYEDRIQSTATDRARLAPESRTEEVFSFFVQDEIELVPERWKLTLGSKFEYNDFVGTQIQPSARLLFQPTSSASWWGSVSRAVRTPGRADRDVRLVYDVLPPVAPGVPPIIPFALGSRNFDSEILVAYEAGVKWQPSAMLSADLALYFNDYDRLRSSEIGPMVCVPGLEPLPACLVNPATQALGIVATQNNRAESKTHGLELATIWRPNDRWQMHATYSYFHGEEKQDAGNYFGDSALVTTPSHQASLRVGFSPSVEWEADVWLRYVGKTAAFNGTEVRDFTTVDLRLARRFTDRVTLSLVGKNLFEDARAQFLSEPVDVPLTEIRRSLFIQFQLSI